MQTVIPWVQYVAPESLSSPYMLHEAALHMNACSGCWVSTRREQYCHAYAGADLIVLESFIHHNEVAAAELAMGKDSAQQTGDARPPQVCPYPFVKIH